VTGDVTVLTGVTLTVEDSVTVKFNNSRKLYVYGTLNAIGSTYGITFTSINASPSSGDWGYIQIGNSSYEGLATFQNCQIEYAYKFYLYNGQATLTGCTLENFYYYGVECHDTLIATNTDINLISYYSSYGYGILAHDGTDATLDNVNITNCSIGLLIENNTIVDITDTDISLCEWPIRYNGPGALTLAGTNHLTGNTVDAIYVNHSSNSNNWILPSLGNSGRGLEDYVPFYFYNSYTINTGGSMEIGSENILKFRTGGLYVNDTLNAVADVGENIYFTSYKDDNWGGDTNNDGTSTLPASGNWYGIIFNDASNDAGCVMRRCQVRFAGGGSRGGVSMENASPVVDSCDFSNSYYGVMMKDVSNPSFSNNTIGSSDMVPIAMSFDADPVFWQNNTLSFSDNEYDAIGILAGTLQANAVLPIRSVTTIPNITYMMLGTVTVPDGLSLTINKDIVLKSYNYSHRIIVQGKMTADATTDSMIVFTSAKDDNYGNPSDTNKDGSITSPVSGDWSGIVFEASSDTTSLLNYCRIKYAELYSTWYNTRYIYDGAITTVNASPTISNCEIKDVVYGIYAFQASNPKIWYNQITNSSKTPIAMSVSADPSFIGNNFTNTTWTALGIIGENLGFNGTIRNRTVAGYVNITYLLLEDLTINSGTYVWVDPSVVIKFDGTAIYVQGGFFADGTIIYKDDEGQIIFTSVKDDNYGNPGDTNDDGSATSPAANDWQTIRFEDTSIDTFNFINNCLIQYAGRNSWGCVTFTNAGGTVSNSILSDSYTYGIRCEGSSTPLFQNVEINNSRLDPIAMSLKSNPTFIDITFNGNGSNGIRILEGTLSSDATLAKRDVAGINNIAYIVDQLTISSNAVLTLEPGVVIKFPYYYSCITVNGALNAVGVQGPSRDVEKIYFSSLKDDAIGGDTNNDGSSSSPAWGNWYSISFNSSGDDSLNVLKNCVVRYGGSGYYASNYKNYGAVRIFDATVNIDSTTIEQSYTSGIGIYGSADPTIKNCEIININSAPISMSMFSNPTFQTNTVANLGLTAIGIVPENYSVNATVPVRDIDLYNNITYYLYSECTINSGTTITIPAGIVFKNSSLLVEGALIVDGADIEPVVFTDYRDDNYGNPGDTNGDGSSSSPYISSSYRLKFADISDDATCSVNHAILRYCTDGIQLYQASPSITNSLFNNDHWGIVLNGVSEPVVDSCTFHDLTYAPLYMSLVSYPSYTDGNVISGTTYKALGIQYETLTLDWTLVKQNFAGIINIPYYFHGGYIIGTSVTLTINPGVVLKFYSTGITVKKGLIAEGGSTADSTIVFTSIKDDFYGGDTNADSTATSPGYTSWCGIKFEGESLDPLCRLDHCIIKYAGYYNYDTYGAIVTNNASPTITHSLLTQNTYGINAHGASNPVVNYCDIYDNYYMGINNVDESFVINAENNWWGDNSGPTHSGNPGGTGDVVSDAVDYNPWLTDDANNPDMGDVSLNGGITAFDASLVLQDVVGSITLNVLQEMVADVSAVAGVTAYDASLILQYVVGLIHWFPAEINRDLDPNDPLLAETLEYMALQIPSDVILNVGSASAIRGEQVTIPLTIENVSGVTSIQTILEYDSEILTFNDVSLSDITGSMQLSVEKNSEAGELYIAMAGTEIMETDGEIIYVTFDVAEQVKDNKNIPITVQQFMANEKDLTELAISGVIMVQGTPLNFAILQNYPNPFNPTTSIQYQIPNDNSRVSICVYNIKGQLVRTLVDKEQDTGFYHVIWDGTGNNGNKVSSGMYFYRMESGTYSEIKKLILMK
ncbi:T9SS C-terminal target domain-containing protein, partial [bacterium]